MNLRSACPWHIHNSPLAAQGARFGGGKGGGGGTTYQQQTTTIPPDVLARYNAVNAQAQQAAQQPFQTYTGQFVAPINPVQQQAIGNIGDISNAYGPYYGGATASTLAGAAAGAPYFGAAGQNIAQAQAGAAPYQQLATQFGLAGTQAVNPQALQTGQYMSPYIQSVVNPTMASLYQQQQQQQSQLAGNLALQGAFGGDRGAIQQANLAQQQGLAAAQTEGNLYNQAYNNALAAAQQQQGVNLGAQQANRAALQQFAPQALGIGQQGFAQGLGAAQAQQGLGAGIIGAGTNVGQALAGYGQGLTQTGLAANQALLAGGTLGQQTQQALNTALYNQFLQQQGYPFQTAQFLANIAEGTGALSGSTTTGVTTQPTSFFSDERVKDDIVEIGRTHDGQPIYKYSYKDEPHRKRIGLIAQDVEHSHPEAVGLAGGIKTVDYDKATKDAEVHRAEGGLVPESMGGAVTEASGLYADGRPGFALSGAVDDTGLPYGAGRVPLSSSLRYPMLQGPTLRTPDKPKSGAQQVAEAAQFGTAATQLYGLGKSGLVGSSKTSNTPASSGLFGYGGEFGSQPKGKSWIDQFGDWISSSTPQRAHGGLIARHGYATDGSVDDPVRQMQDVYSQAPWSSAGKSTGIVPPPQSGAIHKLDAPKLAALPTQNQANSQGTISGAIDLATKLKSGAGSAYDWLSNKIKNEQIAKETIPQGAAMDALTQDAATQAAMGTVWQRGGRVHRNFGGIGALPGGQASNPIVPQDVLEEGDKDEKLQSPGLAPVPPSGAGGGHDKTASSVMKAAGLAASFIPGVGPFLGAGLSIGSSFLKDGGVAGRHHYADGGTEEAPSSDQPAGGVAPPPQRPQHEVFLDTLAPHAVEAGKQTGIDPRIILAQSALETGYGQAAPGNNYFGIKSHGRPGGQTLLTTEYSPERGYYKTQQDFRKYESPEASARDYANFMNTNSLYKKMREAQGLEAQAAELERSGYAAPGYGPKVLSIAQNIEFDPKTGTARFIKPPASGGGLAAAKSTNLDGGDTSGVGGGSAGEGGGGPEDARSLVNRIMYNDRISNRPSRGFGDWATSESTLVPLVTGIGAMLSGESPYLLPNVGRGLVAGAQTYGQIAQEQRAKDIDQQRANIQSMAELQKVYADLSKRRDLALRQGGQKAASLYDARLTELQNMIVSLGGGTMGPVSASRPAAPIVPGTSGIPAVPAPTPTPAEVTRPGGPGVPPVPVTPPAVDPEKPWRTAAVAPDYSVTESNTKVQPESDPNYWRELARNSLDPEAAKRYDERAANLQKEIEDKGMVTNIHGRPEFARGWQQYKNQRIYADQNVKWADQQPAARNARQQALSNLEEISKIVEGFEPGKWANFKGDLVAALNSAGISVPPTYQANPADNQLIIKNAIMQSLAMANQGNSGLTNDKLNAASQTVANQELQPAAMKGILASQKALIKQENRFADDFTKEIEAVPHINRNQYIGEWLKRPENNLTFLREQEAKTTPVLGESLRNAKVGDERMLTPEQMRYLDRMMGRPEGKYSRPQKVKVIEGPGGRPAFVPAGEGENG